MPELPEIETIKLQLQKFLIGHKILRVQVNFRKTLKEGEKKLTGGRINNIRRFGKMICLDLENNYSALFHLKMTGQLIYQGPNLPKEKSKKLYKEDLSPKVVGGVPGKHTHVIFYLDKGGILFFNDYRKFGWVEIRKTSEIQNQKLIKTLGPDALEDLTLEKFREMLTKYNRPVKLLLLDQTKISGVGNIYTNDALFMAKIRPERKGKSLNMNEQKRLYESIHSVLKEAIRRGGSSEQAYVAPDGSEGKYQDYFLVYSREGKPCKNGCGEKIIKIKLAGRGTYYCPKCQK